ncbi:MAG: ATP-binding protein [Thermodesulfobacteriota bacterium]
MLKSWISQRLNNRRFLRYLPDGPGSFQNYPFNVEQTRQIFLLFFISVIGIVVLIPLGILVLVQKNIAIGVSDLILATILTGNVLHAQRYKRYTFNIYLGISFVAMLIVYVFLTGGVNRSAFVWYYTFPLIASFILGSKRGAIATVLMLLPAMGLFLVKNPPSFLVNYDFDFKIRFIVSFFVVFVFSYLFEYSREKNREELERAHNDLEKRVEERTSALQEAIQSLQKEISERRRAEEALRESEEKYRSILENIEDGYYEVDLAGHLTFFNDSVCRMSGRTKEELMGMNDREYTDQENAKKLYQTFNQVYRTGEPRRALDWEVIRKDGTPKYMEASVSLRKDSSGKPIGFRGIVRDVTERKRAEEALKEKTEELARSNRDLEQFAYVASHDLQEPLRMVTSYVQLLARRYKGKLDSDADEFIGFAVDGATHMWKLINDLLTYSRVGMGGKELEPTDCETILNQSLNNLKVAIEEKGAVVTHDPLPTVMAESPQLGQLFQNLIGNAVKFRGNEPPRIHVSASRNGNGWTFSVRDNGIGIAPEYTERIFIIFQRLHNRKEYPGTGIGLAICKKIVERHGGRIWVESEVGKGATFYFTLPASKGEPLSHRLSKEARAEIHG